MKPRLFFTADAVGASTSAGDVSTPEDVSGATTADTISDTTFLFIDVYSLSVNGNPPWDKLAATPHFYGAILKATQGTKGWSNDKGWFNQNWGALKNAGGDRYGDTWFRGAYLFLNFWQNGAEQADHFLNTVEEAGGWDVGDMYPFIDVELGQDGKDGKHKRNPNQDASAQEIIDCTTQCAERIRSATGRNVFLYGRGAMRDKSINDKMGCDAVWNPSYTGRMVTNGLEAWTLDDIPLWQYCGDSSAALDESKFPRTVQGFGKTDISVYIQGSEKPSLERLKERLGIGIS